MGAAKRARARKRESAGTHLDGLVVRNEKRLELIAQVALGGTRQQRVAGKCANAIPFENVFSI